jgi:hypothetical protein
MRGRAMLRPLFAAQAAAWGSVPLLWMPLPGWAWAVINDAGGSAFFGSCIGLGVFLAWNMVHPDRSAREEQRERLADRREEFRRRAEEVSWHGTPLVLPQPGRGVTWTYDEIVTALGREWEARHQGPQPPGSVLRYPGPPAVFTPPHGMELVIHVELRAEPRVGNGGVARLSPDYGWSCEECGEPVTEGRRFCRPCVTHGMTGYSAPEPPSQGPARPRRGTGAGYRWTSPW